jgi:hypothetical protein
MRQERSSQRLVRQVQATTARAAIHDLPAYPIGFERSATGGTIHTLKIPAVAKNGVRSGDRNANAERIAAKIRSRPEEDPPAGAIASM